MSDPNTDTRFQFEVIRQLAESVRELGSAQSRMVDTQTNMLERLAKIEEQRVNESVKDLYIRVDALEKQNDIEQGAKGFRKAIMQYWPAIALFLLVMWTVGRALGFFHLPSPTGD